MLKKIARTAVHVVADSRKFLYKRVAAFADGKSGLTVLELGSGKPVKGENYYSAKHLFAKNNTFVQSDVNPNFGHKIVDITTMDDRDTYDVILCLNVLEHVFEFQKGLDNMLAAIKKGGTLILGLPVFYPLHDEPHDYWRFSEHAIRKLLESGYKDIKLEHTGVREFAHAYYVIATKK